MTKSSSSVPSSVRFPDLPKLITLFFFLSLAALSGYYEASQLTIMDLSALAKLQATQMQEPSLI